MEIINLFSVVMITLILLLLFLGFIYFYLFIAKKENLLLRHGYEPGRKKKTRSLRNRMLLPLVKWSVKAGPVGIKYPFFANIEKHERMIHEAGNPMGFRLEDFYGFRFVLGMIGLGFSTFYSLMGFPFSLQVLLLCLFGGFVGPSLWLYFKAKHRQEMISVMMPDFLDTVSVTLQAGVSLNGALKQVTKQLEGQLSEEIDRFNKEVELGVPQITAYKQLMERNSSKELHSLVNALIQGTSLGVPVARTFKLQADDLRATRGFIAKEKAAKASPQITLVTTFFVAPAVFGLIIGLLVLNIMYNPGAFGIESFFK